MHFEENDNSVHWGKGNLFLVRVWDSKKADPVITLRERHCNCESYSLEESVLQKELTENNIKERGFSRKRKLLKIFVSPSNQFLVLASTKSCGL